MTKAKKQTSDRVSRIAAANMRMLQLNPSERWFGVTRGDLRALCGSVLSQDETKGKRKPAKRRAAK